MENDEQPVSPDDECGVCGTVRDQHGDKHHQFRLDDILIPLPSGPAPRRQPPAEAGSRPPVLNAPPTQGESETPLAKSFATLLEVLVEREVLGAKDIIRIIRGEG